MRNIALFLSMLLIISCAPGKSDNLVRVDVYCDSCFVKVINTWQSDAGANASDGLEICFEGNITGYKSIDIYRYNSKYSCVMLDNYYSYSLDTVDIYFIENADTIHKEHNLQLQTSFCH